MKRIRICCSNKWIIAISVVCITFFINYLIASKCFGYGLLLSEPKYEDSELKSFYERLAYNSPILLKNEDIAIIETDGINREEIASLLHTLIDINPSVIGLDITFAQQSDNDSLLLAAIDLLQDRIVMPLRGGSYNDLSGGFEDTSGSFFDSFFHRIHLAYVNLGQSNINNNITRYRYNFMFQGVDIPSFGMAIYRLYSKEKSENYNEDSFLLEFGKTYFESIPARELINKSIDGKSLNGKIVILGDVHNAQDIHPTVVGDLPGPTIHAYAINTLINKRDAHSPNWFIIYLIMIVFTLLFAWVMIWGKYSMEDFGNLFVRLVQLLLLVLIYVIGSFVFIRCNMDINWLLPLSMIATEALVFDVIIGLIWLIKKQ